MGQSLAIQEDEEDHKDLDQPRDDKNCPRSQELLKITRIQVASRFVWHCHQIWLWIIDVDGDGCVGEMGDVCARVLSVRAEGESFRIIQCAACDDMNMKRTPSTSRSQELKIG